LETALGLQADGALAPLMAVFPGHLRRIPDELGTLEAAGVEPTATALRAVELAGELAGRTVLVTGGGPIGQLACRLAHLRSPAQILLMEPAAQRARFATDSHAVSLAADAAEGYASGLGVDVVLECSGSAAATSTALKLLAPGGILVVVGAGPDPALDSATILLKEITVRGSYIYTDEFDRAIHLLATQQIAVADLTTVISPLPDALTAFDALRAGRIMKALIAPGNQPQRPSDTQAKRVRK
jgi:threonine dehydrogenase-like Zn-dependent dehydrogenase